MLRKTLTILSLIGLLLSVGLWGVSYLNIAIVVFPHTLSATSGVLSYSHRMDEFDRPTYERDLAMWRYSWLRVGDKFYLMSKNPPRHSTAWWFPNDSVRWSGPVQTGVWLPIWMLVVVWGTIFLICRPPAHFLRRRKRKKLGLCLKCGYDLRASKARCPECGETK